ncbi:MAG TPA: LapA family protein, partial [Candidatus Angelobacter sp.]|nr:LapA family protein [Candidatus Angelobacter sp.]
SRSRLYEPATSVAKPGCLWSGARGGGEYRMAIVGWLTALLLGIVLALFSVGNQQPASINVLGATYQDIPTWTVILASAAIGALMVIVISLVDRLRWFMNSRFTKKVLNEHKRMIVERDNRIAELEQEVFRLRGAA